MTRRKFGAACAGLAGFAAGRGLAQTGRNQLTDVNAATVTFRSFDLRFDWKLPERGNSAGGRPRNDS